MTFEDKARSNITHIMCCDLLPCGLVDCTKVSIEHFVSLFRAGSLSTLETERKFWGQPTKVHGVTCQKILILMLVEVRTSNFTSFSLFTTFLNPQFIKHIISENVVTQQHISRICKLSSRYFENSL